MVDKSENSILRCTPLGRFTEVESILSERRVRLYSCQVCGAVVENDIRHDNWHDALNEKVK